MSSSTSTSPSSGYVTISIACMYRDDRVIQSIINDIKQKLSIFYYILFFFWYFVFKWITYYAKKFPYTHCEICFPLNNNNYSSDGTTTVEAFGVSKERSVFRSERRFNTTTYRWIHISVTREQSRVMRDYCMKLVEKSQRGELTYDDTGLNRSLFYPRKKLLKNKIWCTPMIIKVLQKGGIMTQYRETSQDADDIVKFLTNQSNIVQALPPNTSAQRLICDELGISILDT